MRADAASLSVLLLLSVSVYAAAEDEADVRVAQVERRPDTELLEYIAAFEPVGGAWVDPMHFYDSFEADTIATENDHE